MSTSRPTWRRADSAMSASGAPLETRHGDIQMTAAAAEPVLVTGAAGFIRFSFARRLLERGRAVIGIDNVNNYYDPALKEARLPTLPHLPRFTFHLLHLSAPFATHKPF